MRYIINILILLCFNIGTSEFIHSKNKTIAIIGAGPSGLASAKSAKEVGLDVTIFEANSDIGGLWNPIQGATWNTLNTNLSKFTCNFSDFPWDSHESLFPSRNDMYYYMKSYINHFELSPCIKLNTTVTNLIRNELTNKWIVSYNSLTNPKSRKKSFDFVIVASGFFSKPKLPNLNFNKFKGSISHSKYYKTATPYEGKVVAVVGGAFSAVEIASDVYKKATKVYHLSSRGLWIAPRCIKVLGRSIPLDLIFFHENEPTSSTPLTLYSQLFHTYRSSNQDVVPYLTIELSKNPKPPILLTSDIYPELIKDERVVMINKPIKDLSEHSIVFEDDELEVDAIIFCTGFCTQMSFFNEELLDKLSFDPQNFLYPLVLHESVFHPNLPNLAFVGMYRRSYIGIMELQARWATLAFIEPEKYLPSKETMQKSIEELMKQRNLPPGPQSFYGGYTTLMKKLAKTIQADSILSDPRLSECPIIPAMFRMSGPFSKPEIAIKSINQCLKYLGLPLLDR